MFQNITSRFRSQKQCKPLSITFNLNNDYKFRNIRQSKDKKSISATCFRDGKRKIDAIIVYNSSKKDDNRKRFLRNLKKMSLELEKETSMFDHELVFVKIHGNEKLLRENAVFYGVPVKYNQITSIAEDTVPCDRLKNILNDPKPDPEHHVAKRAWPTISKAKPTKLTNCERHAIVFTMMQNVHFGDESEPFQIGLELLYMEDGFITAYPLHDGPWEWPADPTSPLNDRQLLARYWAGMTELIKQQPHTTIENYFGPGIALYFAWLGLYNRMLFVAALMGIAAYGVGIIQILVDRPSCLDEVCQSELLLCPLCKKCPATPIKEHCFDHLFAYVHDHATIVLFACAMSFWGQAFMEVWKRRQNILILKWNLNTALDDQVRPEFRASAPNVRQHAYTGEMEQYIPLSTKLFTYTLSVTVVFFMLLSVVALIFLITLAECFLHVYNIASFTTSFITSILTLLVMMILRYIYAIIAIKLTNKENPRTKSEYDKSYMIKIVVFSLVNNYGTLMYLAFFKGKFFTYPGDHYVRMANFPIAAEICSPPGCVSEVAILLGTITILMPIISNFIEIMTPIVISWRKKVSIHSHVPTSQLHPWEQDYDLNDEFDCMGEVEEMVMQYGFVTLLVAAFPLTPFLALCNNVFEIRIDSSKLVKYFRRPTGIYSTSMEVWFDTLQSLTYVAIVTNALYISFTTNFIPSIVYYYLYRKDFKGFYFFLLSKYKVTDNYWTEADISECYYRSLRYPPEHPEKYTILPIHYYILTCRLGFALVFIVLVLFITGIISYAVPDIPSGIQDLIKHNARIERSRDKIV